MTLVDEQTKEVVAQVIFWTNVVVVALYIFTLLLCGILLLVWFVRLFRTAIFKRTTSYIAFLWILGCISLGFDFVFFFLFYMLYFFSVTLAATASSLVLQQVGDKPELREFAIYLFELGTTLPNYFFTVSFKLFRDEWILSRLFWIINSSFLFLISIATTIVHIIYLVLISMSIFLPSDSTLKPQIKNLSKYFYLACVGSNAMLLFIFFIQIVTTMLILCIRKSTQYDKTTFSTLLVHSVISLFSSTIIILISVAGFAIYQFQLLNVLKLEETGLDVAFVYALIERVSPILVELIILLTMFLYLFLATVTALRLRDLFGNRILNQSAIDEEMSSFIEDANSNVGGAMMALDQLDGRVEEETNHHSQEEENIK